MKTKLTFLLSLTFLFLFSGNSFGVDLKKKMTVNEFNNSGLNKLTDSEITELSKWLDGYLKKTIKVFLKGSLSTSADVIESRIDDDFEGWEGETIFKLDNGQIWQQSSYSYMYTYKYRPKVFIYKSGGGYKMSVEGVGQSISVRRLK